METKSYLLSPAFKLIPAARLIREKLPQNEEVQRIFDGELFVMANQHTWHLLNPAIHIFLTEFEKPNTPEEVTLAFAKKLNCKPDAVREKVMTFFKSMKKRKILIPSTGSNQKVEEKKTAIFQTGDLLGGYRIEKRIFHKPKVEIYIAENINGGQKVAVKILRTPSWLEPHQQKKLRHSFGQEFRLLQELGHHPNVCQLLEFVENDQYSYAILELLDNLNLRNVFKKQKLNLEKRVDLMNQLLSAMAFVHKGGIVHGDIHLSNILIHQNDTVKLIDFNMSNRLQPAENEIVREGGVYQYIPPEKVDARAFRMVTGMADCCSEVFQLGVVMYFVFYQKMPFDDFTWQRLAQRILNHQPAYPLHTPDGEPIPEWILRMMKKSLEKDPAKRFPSAVEQYRKWSVLQGRYQAEMEFAH